MENNPRRFLGTPRSNGKDKVVTELFPSIVMHQLSGSRSGKLPYDDVVNAYETQLYILSMQEFKNRIRNNPHPVTMGFPIVGCRTKCFARVNFFMQSNKSNFQKVRYQRKEFIHVFRSQIWRVLFVRQIFKYKGHVGI